MNRHSLKIFFALLLVFMLMLGSTVASYAETVQDSVEAWINGLVDEYKEAETPEERESLQEQLDKFLKENNIDTENIDLGSLNDTDIGKIIKDMMGDGSAFGDFFSLASDAWKSGIAMIQDAFNKGTGTSDGSNTATTKPSVTSPNVIIADEKKPESTTQAVGIQIAPPTTSTPVTVPAETTTYNIGETTAPDIIGSGVTTTAPAPSANVTDNSMPASSIAVLIILTAATLAIITAIVIFFARKHN